MNYTFIPLSNTASISGSTTSASASLGGSGGTSLRVYNASSAVAYVRWGSGAQTAVTTDTYLAPGATETFQINGNMVDTVAAILSTGTGSVLFQRGHGA